jgi:hypothetical protein
MDWITQSVSCHHAARVRHARQEIPCFGLSSCLVCVPLPPSSSSLSAGGKEGGGEEGRGVHCRHVPRRAVIRMLFYSLVPVALCGGQVHPGVESCAHIGTAGAQRTGRA